MLASLAIQRSRTREHRREEELDCIREQLCLQPGLGASLALNIDRLQFDVIQLQWAVEQVYAVVRATDELSVSEVLHDVLRLLQSTICSVIRVAAEPHALCARIGITVEQYAALMPR